MNFSPKQFTLLNLLADGLFHSGTELADILGISRAAIWKHLNTLADFGVEVIAVSGKGYRLKQPLELLSSQAIQKNLTPIAQHLLSKLEIHPHIHSTNTYLAERAKIKPESGLVCFAELQTAGRGRRGRHWVSPFGSNIYLSVLWQFQSGFASIAGLSLAIGVAVVRALQELGVQDIGLKWPNDIYWQQKKLGGILIEVFGETEGQCQAVIGLGLNLHLATPETETIEQPWTDLKQILDGQAYSRNKIASLLINQLLPVIAQFEEQGLQNYLSEWRNYDCMQDKEVSVYIGQHEHQGTVEGISDEGMLLLKNTEGEIKTFASGEVSFRSL